MLSKEENALLTQVGPGTPCGELMRRYWQPTALSEEVPPNGPPLPVRLLGEDLVLYRDDRGRPGLLGIHCSHRGADLSYGRLEYGGLRCIYHGWLYDLEGRCLEQPGEPAGSTFHEKIQHPAYPCQEHGDIIFSYMGSGQPPLFPNYDPFLVPADHVSASKVFSDCNYLQGNEGNIDLIHNDFLHFAVRDLSQLSAEERQAVIDRRGAPEVLTGRGPNPGQQRTDAQVVDVGLRICKTRVTGSDQNYIRVDTFVLPNLTVVPGGTINWHVPIDDTHHWRYGVSFNREQPIDRDRPGRVREDNPAGPAYYPLRNRSNRYLQDRESMTTWSYSGIGATNLPQDLAVTEGAGPIQDRTQEHLAISDAPIAAARQVLLGAIQRVQEGQDPPNVVRDPQQNRFPEIVATFGLIPAEVLWKDYCADLVAEGRGWQVGGRVQD